MPSEETDLETDPTNGSDCNNVVEKSSSDATERSIYDSTSTNPADLSRNKTCRKDKSLITSDDQLQFEVEKKKNDVVTESISNPYTPVVGVQKQPHSPFKVDPSIHVGSTQSNLKSTTPLQVYNTTPSLKESGNLHSKDKTNVNETPLLGTGKAIERQSNAQFRHNGSLKKNNERIGPTNDDSREVRNIQRAGLHRLGNQKVTPILPKGNIKHIGMGLKLSKHLVRDDNLPNHSYVYDRKVKHNVTSKVYSKKILPLSTRIIDAKHKGPTVKRSRTDGSNGLKNDHSTSELDDKTSRNKNKTTFHPTKHDGSRAASTIINGNDKGKTSNDVNFNLEDEGKSIHKKVLNKEHNQSSNIATQVYKENGDSKNASSEVIELSKETKHDSDHFKPEVATCTMPNLQNYSFALGSMGLGTGPKRDSLASYANTEKYKNEHLLNQSNDKQPADATLRSPLNSRTIETNRAFQGLVFPTDLESILSLAGSMVASEIRSGKWARKPKDLKDQKHGTFDKDMHLNIAASAIEKFVCEVILPSFISEGMNIRNGSEYQMQCNSQFETILVAAFLSLREVLAINSEIIFFLKNKPDLHNQIDLTKDADKLEAIPGDSRRHFFRQHEEYALQSQLLSTALILSTISKLPSDISSSVCKKFLESIKKYDMADEEFTSSLDRADGYSNCVVPNGQTIGREENVSWRISFNRCRDSHHLIKGRERKNALYQHSISEVIKDQFAGKENITEYASLYHKVSIPAPNVCATYIVEAIPFEKIKKIHDRNDKIKRIRHARHATLKHRHMLRRLAIKRMISFSKSETILNSNICSQNEKLQTEILRTV